MQAMLVGKPFPVLVFRYKCIRSHLIYSSVSSLLFVLGSGNIYFLETGSDCLALGLLQLDIYRQTWNSKEILLPLSQECWD